MNEEKKFIMSEEEANKLVKSIERQLKIQDELLEGLGLLDEGLIQSCVMLSYYVDKGNIGIEEGKRIMKEYWGYYKSKKLLDAIKGKEFKRKSILEWINMGNESKK